MSEKISQILYISRASNPFDAAALEQLANLAQANNASLGVTGILYYTQEFFMQLIEGQEKTLKELYKTIQEDQRHQDVTTLLERVVPERSFPAWDMNVVTVQQSQAMSQEKLARIENHVKDVKSGVSLPFVLLCEFITPDEGGTISIGAFNSTETRMRSN